MNRSVTFTLGGALAGARRSVPLCVSVFAYGTAFGVLARQTELTLIEALVMSTVVCAGSAQLVVLELWTHPLPMLTIVFTTLVVNLRHVLMGAALHPWFSHLSASRAYSSAFFMGDENWALTMGEFGRGRTDGAFLLGSGLALSGAWLGASAFGYLLGALVSNPARFGLDFAFPAVLVALLVSLWKGHSDITPWAAAAAVAIIAAQALPGKWYILLGGLSGSFAGVLKRGS